jgi:hypothetical protein
MKRIKKKEYLFITRRRINSSGRKSCVFVLGNIFDDDDDDVITKGSIKIPVFFCNFYILIK